MGRAIRRRCSLSVSFAAALFLASLTGCGASTAPSVQVPSATSIEVAPVAGPASPAEPSSKVVEIVDLDSKFAKELSGKVIGLADGDTITVLDEGRRSHKIRLEGIDAPEKRQDYGTKCQEALAAKIFGQQVRICWSTRDKYDRILGHVYLGDRWINKELVAEGWAWHFKRYSSDPELAAAEVAAREAKSGLWADPNRPVAPWDYRARPMSAPQGLVGPTDERVERQSSHWLNTSSNVRHNRGCKYFGNTSQGHYCGPDEGKACGICGG